MVVHDWGLDDPFRSDGAGRRSRFVRRDSTQWRHERVRVFWHDAHRRGITGRVCRVNYESPSIGRERDMYAVPQVQRVYDGGTSLYPHEQENIRPLSQLRVLD